MSLTLFKKTSSVLNTPLNSLIQNKLFSTIQSRIAITPQINNLQPIKLNNSRSLYTGTFSFSRKNINNEITWSNLQQKRSMFIDVDPTPNVNTLKFKPKGVTILPDNKTLEFLTFEKAEKESPLALELMDIEGVESVLFGMDFISITKKQEYEWQMLKPDVYVVITDFIESKEPILSNSENVNQNNIKTSCTINEDDSEVVKQIKEIMESKVRPALQQDGGDVDFIEYKDNIIKVSLRGACRTCAISAQTLKNGIENLFKHYIPEVKAVENVIDPTK